MKNNLSKSENNKTNLFESGKLYNSDKYLCDISIKDKFLVSLDKGIVRGVILLHEKVPLMDIIIPKEKLSESYFIDIENEAHTYSVKKNNTSLKIIVDSITIYNVSLNRYKNTNLFYFYGQITKDLAEQLSPRN